MSVINETVKTLEATLILNQFSKSCQLNRYEVPTTSVMNTNTKSEKGAKYTLTRVIKKVTFHPNKSNENNSPDKRVELMFVWGGGGSGGSSVSSSDLEVVARGKRFD